MTTKAKDLTEAQQAQLAKLPAFDVAAGALARSGADRLVRPLPPPLARLVEDSDAAKAHHDVGARYSEARTRVAGIREALVKAKRRDEERLRDSLARGTRQPKAQAPGLESQLEEAEHKLQLLDGLVVEYATGLLRVAVERLPEALEESERRLDAALAGVRESLENALASLAAANEAAAEHDWLVGLKVRGHVHPYGGGSKTQILPGVTESLARARQAFDGDLAQREEFQEEASRHRAHEQASLAPGQLVWANGRSYRVVENGELEEVER
jgi:hypothetical protein